MGSASVGLHVKGPSKVSPVLSPKLANARKGGPFRASKALRCQSIRKQKMKVMIIQLDISQYHGLSGGIHAVFCSGPEMLGGKMEDKREEGRLGHLPGVTQQLLEAKSPAQSWVLRPPLGTDASWYRRCSTEPQVGPATTSPTPHRPAKEGSGFIAQHWCPYLKGKHNFSSVPS